MTITYYKAPAEDLQVQFQRLKRQRFFQGLKRLTPTIMITVGASLLISVGYPIIFEFLPDIDSFYRDWLERPLPDEKEFKDMSQEVINKWAAKA